MKMLEKFTIHQGILSFIFRKKLDHKIKSVFPCML